MTDKFKKLSEFDTKTREELRELETDSYIPTFITNQENTKIDVSDLSTELSAGENVTINNKIDAVDTSFSAGTNIEIITVPTHDYDIIKYKGNPLMSYIGGTNVNINNNNVITPKFPESSYGHKLCPVTFEEYLDENSVKCYKLVDAGYTSDTIFIQSVNRTTDQFIYIDAESIQRRDMNRLAEVGAYYWLNTKTMDYTWNKQDPSGGGLNKVLPTLYTNFVIDNTERIKGIILTTSFLMNLNEHELIFNFVNRETETLKFALRNDSNKTLNHLVVYEQGKVFEIDNWTKNTTKYIVNYTSDNPPKPSSSLSGYNVAAGIYPPFCGNVVYKNITYAYNRLYSSIRFIVLFDGDSINLMSSVY